MARETMGVRYPTMLKGSARNKGIDFIGFRTFGNTLLVCISVRYRGRSMMAYH